MRFCEFFLLTALGLGCAVPAAMAAPWAEVGDNQLRSDVELLAASGFLQTVTIQWPLPWTSLVAQLDSADLSLAPDSVRAAAARVLAKAHTAQMTGLRTGAYADVTNRAAVVYGFDGMGRGDGQAQAIVEAQGGAFYGRVALGVITNDFGGKPNKLMADGTYLAADLADVRFYAGYITHWWGPGQISALQLSNNARPMPQIGFSRASTDASSWPVLRWLGPWQFEFFVGKLDGPQIQSNVLYNAARLTISPLPGLEIAAAKTEEFCGQGHSCAPLRDYFQNFDFSTHPNNVNGEGTFDLKYSNALLGTPFQVYGQVMNEDYSFANHSGTSHLVGASVWLGHAGNPVKLTAEFTDTIATLSMFSFGDYLYGFTYNDYQYLDGMRYRGRTLGFSLDNDSTLLSLQGSWTDPGGRLYELSLHHATISDARSAGLNVVSPVPVKLNMAELRISLPLNFGHGQGVTLDLAGRLQDDQPRPHEGFAAAIEAAIRIGL